MKVLKMLSSALLVTIFCLLALPLMAAEPAHLIPAGVNSLTIFITIGLICLVVGLGLRGFSKPPADLSINQPKK